MRGFREQGGVVCASDRLGRGVIHVVRSFRGRIMRFGRTHAGCSFGSVNGCFSTLDGRTGLQKLRRT